MTRQEFQKHMDMATNLVNSWPPWKQNLLEQSSKPTVSVPRQPVINKRHRGVSVAESKRALPDTLEATIKLTPSLLEPILEDYLLKNGLCQKVKEFKFVIETEWEDRPGSTGKPVFKSVEAVVISHIPVEKRKPAEPEREDDMAHRFKGDRGSH